MGVRRVTAVVEDCGAVDLEGIPIAVGDVRLELEWVDDAIRPVLVGGPGGGVAGGALLAGGWALEGDATPRLWRQGYQSWSWSGVLELEPLQADDDGFPIAGGDESPLSPAFETPWTSWWAALVGRPGGAMVHVGAVEAQRTKVWTAWSSEDPLVAVIWGGRGEFRFLAEGESWTLDPVVVSFGRDAYRLWADWAQAVADRAAPPLTDLPPSGWGSWYRYYTAIDEETVFAELDAAHGLYWGGEPQPVFQVDDGWQVAWGDWQAGSGFPSGMAPVAQAISDSGFRPGLWMAPLYVDRSTPTYQGQADWWLRDFDGVEVGYTNLGGGDYAVLDVSHPGARTWLADQIATKVAQGWTYLKLDFLSAGAQEGLRWDQMTGTEAYQLAMRTMRQAAGPDTFLLASGAPMLPSVGWVQGWRSGADIAFEVSPDPHPAFVRWQARQTAARSWANGVWWWNDPDALLVRHPLSRREASGAVAVQAVSGGTWLLGDAVTELGHGRLTLALHADALELRGARSRPLDPMRWPSGLDASPLAERLNPDDQVPPTWLLDDHHLVVLNLGDTDRTAVVPPGTEVLSGRSSDRWSERVLPPGSGEIWRTTR